MENKIEKTKTFLAKMDYRIAVFSLLFLVVGVIAGSRFGGGHHRSHAVGESCVHRQEGAHREGSRSFEKHREQKEENSSKHRSWEERNREEGKSKKSEEKKPETDKNNANEGITSSDKKES